MFVSSRYSTNGPIAIFWPKLPKPKSTRMADRMLYEAVVSPGRRTLNDAGLDFFALPENLPENDSWKVRRSKIWPTASVLEHSSRARTMSGVGFTMGRVPYRLQGGTIWFMRA